MFCTTGLVSSKKVAQMYVEEIHFRNCYLNGFGTFDPGDFDIMTQKFLHHQGWMCGPSLREVRQGVLELLTGNDKVTDGQTDR